MGYRKSFPATSWVLVLVTSFLVLSHNSSILEILRNYFTIQNRRFHFAVWARSLLKSFEFAWDVQAENGWNIEMFSRPGQLRILQVKTWKVYLIYHQKLMLQPVSELHKDLMSKCLNVIKTWRLLVTSLVSWKCLNLVKSWRLSNYVLLDS